MRPLILPVIFSWLLMITPESSEGYRILGVFPFHGRSHFVMFEALMKGLARKGHQVDVISPFPQKKPYPNYKDIIYLESKQPEIINNMTYDHFRALGNDVGYYIAGDMGNTICERLGEPDMLELIRNPPKNPSYDLVLTEIFGAHCYMAFGYHLNVPVIGMSSSALYPWGHRFIANPANLAFAANNLLNYVPPMTFWQRFHNTVHAFYTDLVFQHYTSPQDRIIKKYFGENAPGVRESERNLALVLTNTHPALNNPRPITSSLIEVGGLHVQDEDVKLPQDLKEWMDSSTDGFIYFTFGSMVTIESFPEETLKIFYKSLAKIAPTRVLVKIPDAKKLPPGLPKNIRTFVWAPQLKVLQHKNVKAFITHGGLMGGQEAIHYAVPMIGIPLFGDQYINVDVYAGKKIGVKLNYQGITEGKFDTALNEILHNPTYKKAITKLSRKFLDRPMNALDTAIWWSEYVIRHGSDALRSPAMDLAWWQIELLDVYASLLMIVVLAILATITVVKFISNIFFGSQQPTVPKSKKVK